MTKRRIITHIIALCVLTAGYMLCENVLFDYFTFGDMAGVYFWAGCFVTVVSFFANGRIVPICASAGYWVSFAAGAVSQTDGVDPGGAPINNLWVIWGCVYVGIIALSIVCEIVLRIIRKKKPQQA